MIVNFANIDYSERPTLILKNAGGTPLGVLGYAKNVAPDLKYNEISTIEFDLPAYVDGVKTPLYDDVVGMRVLELSGVGQFSLVNPSESGDGVQMQKSCKGYSLEYEFAYKKITIPDGTYKFWDILNPDNTVLGMIMELMPSWSLGDISYSIVNKYRTFEINNENLYNFIKGTIQETYQCIFNFDTQTRTVHVRDVSDEPRETPVYIASENLAKSIQVTENTEDIITRLDVNGAEGVSIRNVNPNGTNKIINLDYYMTATNFSSELIAKYYSWKTLLDNNRNSYYSLSVQYSLKVMQKITEEAKLADLRGELTSLENIQAVTIQGIAQGLSTQTDLNQANANIAAKQAEIAAQQSSIDAIASAQTTIMNQLAEIQSACSFTNYFTASERTQLDRYIKDDAITEGTFVMSDASSFTDAGLGAQINNKQLSITGAAIVSIECVNSEMFDIRGGALSFDMNGLTANVISATLETRDNSLVLSAYLGSGSIQGHTFPSACISITGTLGSQNCTATTLNASVSTGFCYFSLDASEYEKRSVAWDLYEYGEAVLAKLSQPTYTFSITSANFFSIEEFEAFKNNIVLGEKIYTRINDDTVLKPIFIGVRFVYDSPDTIDLQFSDSYASNDSTFRLVDLLEKSISMGKTLDVSKYIYSAFIDSGANTGIKAFMESALDVAKNAVLSSTEQAISWDGSGFRLRCWANPAHTAYEPEQIWMINNSIVMTDDNWATAKMAMGKFHDENLGDCWGIVAPRIVGTLLAGNELIIESAKREGGVSVFRVDGEGVRLFNGDLSVIGSNTHIALNPQLGFVIGAYPVFNINGNVTTLNEDNAKFWVDHKGNMHFKGTLHAADGEFTGNVTALSLVIGDTPVEDYVGNHIDDVVDPLVENTINPLIDTVNNIYDGTTGIFFTNSSVGTVKLNKTDGLKIIGTDNTYFQAKNNAMGFFNAQGAGMLYYENGNMVLKGIISALGGYIGGENGWIIGTRCMYNGGASTLGTSGGIYLGTDGVSIGSAIVMEPDGAFLIRGDSGTLGANNFALKILPEHVDAATVYRLYLGNVIFDDSFVLPVEHGGTGGIDRESAGGLVGVYRASSATEMSAISDTINGDLCVLYSAGQEGLSISGSFLSSPVTYPGYLSIGAYNAAGHQSGYFDITNISYWNVASLSGENVSSSYARVGVGHTSSGACGLYVPLSINISGGSGDVTSIKLQFVLNTRPSNCARDLCSKWSNGIIVSLYHGGTGQKMASTTYMLPSGWQNTSNVNRTATLTLNSATRIMSGEYYVAFHTRSTYSLMWIQPASVSLVGTSIGSADGLYVRSNNMWKAIASSGEYGTAYVLPSASANEIGGVKIGNNITLSGDGTISLSANDIIQALGYTPGNGSSAITISNLTNEGSRIATFTIDGVNYDIYAPTSGGGGTSSTVDISNRLTSGTRIATITIDGSGHDLYAPNPLATPVSVENGGTGATTARAAINNLGIFYAATLPATGIDGQICLVPV